MRLGEFILARLEPILVEWEGFASTLLPAAARLDSLALRDHARLMLEAIADDLSRDQSAEAQVLKSKGLARAVDGAPRTAAQEHATLRAHDGFNIQQVTAEYRALRATVLRLWLAEFPGAPEHLQDAIRFNEAIDQALAESVRDFSLAVENSRNLLLGMLGHDMRNPLSVIVATASYLTQLNAGTEVSVAARRLMKSGGRIQELVNDLVDFSRTQLGVGINVMPAPVDLASLFSDELDLQRAAHPGRHIVLEVYGDVVGSWDANRVHQALGNLVSNALRYGAASTPVKVTLAGHSDSVRFSVENHGAPIPAGFVAEMFEPLARGPKTSAIVDGTDSSLGLGLYITREIVRAHRGSIEVRSDDSGTVFEIELPRSTATMS